MRRPGPFASVARATAWAGLALASLPAASLPAAAECVDAFPAMADPELAPIAWEPTAASDVSIHIPVTVALDPATVTLGVTAQVWSTFDGAADGVLTYDESASALDFTPVAPWSLGAEVWFQTSQSLLLTSGLPACAWGYTFQIAPSGGEGTLVAKGTADGAAWPYDLVAADLDGDGWTDLMQPDRLGGAVVLWSEGTPLDGLDADGAAPWTTQVEALDFAGGPTGVEGDPSVRNIAAADLDLDGDLDLVAAAGSTTGGTYLNDVAVFLSDGPASRTFAPVAWYNTGTGPRSVAAVDMNGDSWPDLVTADETDTTATTDIDHTVSVLLADPATPGTFFPIGSGSPDSVYVGFAPRWVEPVDIDADGVIDVAVARMEACNASETGCVEHGYIDLLSNDGTGTLTVARSVELPFVGGKQCIPHSLKAADFDRDGQPEIAVVPHRCGALLIWDPGETADDGWTVIELSAGDQMFPAGYGDVDGDGYLDVLIPDRSYHQVFLVRSDGDAELSLDGSFVLSASSPQGAILADLDGDGDLDGGVSAVPSVGETLVLLENVRDFDNDGWDASGGDCDDYDSTVNPDASETDAGPTLGVGVDNDCDGEVDEGTFWVDDDGDGWSEYAGDCDDAAADISPSAEEVGCNPVDEDCDGLREPITPEEEVVGDAIDNDCDGAVDEDDREADVDGDGESLLAGDCDDLNSAVNSGAREDPLDELDNDCDGVVDEGGPRVDDDGDGYADPDEDGDGVVDDGGDCDDRDPAIHPGADEVVDGVDNDCDPRTVDLSVPTGCDTAGADPGAGLALFGAAFLLARRSRRAVWVSGWLIGAAWAADPPKPPEAPRSRALVIGVDAYEDPAMPPLDFPSDDAWAVADALEAPALGGFDEVVRLTGAERPTRTRILGEIDRFRRQSMPDDVLVVYFSGHAVIDDDDEGVSHHYLMPADARRALPSSTGISVDFLNEILDLDEAKGKVLIVDACYSFDQGARRKGLATATPSPFRYTIELLAAGETLDAQEDVKLGHGVYTHFLLEALRSPEGIADHDGTGGISAYEAHAYAADRTQEYTGGRQVPMVRVTAFGVAEVVLSGSRPRSPDKAALGTLGELRFKGLSMTLTSIGSDGELITVPVSRGVGVPRGVYQIEVGRLGRPSRYRTTATLERGFNPLEDLLFSPLEGRMLWTAEAGPELDVPLGLSAQASGVTGGFVRAGGEWYSRGWLAVQGGVSAGATTAPSFGETSGTSQQYLRVDVGPGVHAGRRSYDVSAALVAEGRLTLGGLQRVAPVARPGVGVRLSGWRELSPELFAGARVQAVVVPVEPSLPLLQNHLLVSASLVLARSQVR